MQPFASFDELELHLGRTLDDRSGAEQALTLASGAVRSYCHWEISRNKTAQMQVYGDGSRMITLPTLLLNDIISIVENGVDRGPITGWSVDLAWSRKGQIHRPNPWCKDAVIDVVCDHGYDDDAIPDVIKLVTLDAATRQVTNPESLISAATGEVSRTWSSTSGGSSGVLSTLHMALLDNYRVF